MSCSPPVRAMRNLLLRRMISRPTLPACAAADRRHKSTKTTTAKSGGGSAKGAKGAKGSAKGSSSSRPKSKKTLVAEEKARKKSKLSKWFPKPDLKNMAQFSLCDAMRILRACEVGRPPHMATYDIAARLVAMRHAQPVRNRIMLPHPIKMQSRIIVVCKEGSAAAAQATAAGAVATGEESLFRMIKERRIKFDKVLAHTDSYPALQRSGLGPILRTLMPSPRTRTVTPNVAKTIKDMSGSTEYREKMGVVRLSIGSMGFTPPMLRSNLKAFVDQLNVEMEEMAQKNEVNTKSLREMVLSTTNGPGLSLDGFYQSAEPGLLPEHLSGPV